MPDQAFVKTDERYQIEACIETAEEAIEAQSRGAGQVEVCSRLDLDGLFPDVGLIRFCQRELSCHLKVMIRPRSGDFNYSNAELAVMQGQLSICKELQVKEVVLGVTSGGQINLEALEKLVRWTHPMQITFHKAIDTTHDPLLELSRLLKTDGIKSVLTSGGAPSAMEGIPTLRAMMVRAGDQLSVIPAGKIVPANIKYLHEELNASVYHGRNILGPLK